MWLRCHSSNPVGYKSRLLWTQSIQYTSAPASITSPPLQVFTSPLPAAPGCSMPKQEDFVSEVPVVPIPSGRKSLRASQLALFLTPLAYLPRGCRSQLRKPALFQYSLQLHWNREAAPQLCGAASCSCEPELAIWCSISQSGLDTPVARFWLLSVAQVPALACLLLPSGATLLNKTYVLLFITVLRSLSFLIPH